MTFFFFGALCILILGFAQMNWLALVFAIPAFLYSVYRLDSIEAKRQQEYRIAKRQEHMAKGNGRPHGHVDLVVRSGDE
jgi:hypothetical protein